MITALGGDLGPDRVAAGSDAVSAGAGPHLAEDASRGLVMVDAPLPSLPLTLSREREAWLREYVLPLEGWCTPGKAARLAALVCERRAQASVDLGVFGARSTVALATGHHLVGGYVLGVDAWAPAPALEGTNDPANDAWWGTLDLEAIYVKAVDAMVRADLAGHWQFLRLHSQAATDYVPEGSIDLLHQDSNHSEEVSCAELGWWMPKMRPGALWVMDDTDWPSLQVAQYRLKREYGATLLEDHTQWRVYQLPGGDR